MEASCVKVRTDVCVGVGWSSGLSSDEWRLVGGDDRGRVEGSGAKALHEVCDEQREPAGAE